MTTLNLPSAKEIRRDPCAPTSSVLAHNNVGNGAEMVVLDVVQGTFSPWWARRTTNVPNSMPRW